MVVQSGEPQPSWWANLPSDSRLAQGALNQSYSKFCCQHRWHWCTLKLGRTDFGFSFLIFTQSLLVLGPFQPKSSFSPLPSWGNMALSFSLKVAVSPFEQAHPLLLSLLSTFTQWPECPFKSGMLLGAEATGMPWERSLLPSGGRLLAGGDFLQHRQQARQASIKFTRWSSSARALTGKWHSKNIEPALRRVVSYLFGCTGSQSGLWDIVRWPEIEPGPPAWKQRALATEPPGEFQGLYLILQCLWAPCLPAHPKGSCSGVLHGHTCYCPWASLLLPHSSGLSNNSSWVQWVGGSHTGLDSNSTLSCIAFVKWKTLLCPWDP